MILVSDWRIFHCRPAQLACSNEAACITRVNRGVKTGAGLRRCRRERYVLHDARTMLPPVVGGVQRADAKHARHRNASGV